MHSFIHCIHSFIHPSIHPSIRSSCHASIHPFIHSSVDSETSDHPPTPFSLPSSLYSPTLHHIPQFDRVCFSSYYNPFSILPQSSAEPSVKNRFITLIGNWLGWICQYALATNAYKSPSFFLHSALSGISIDFRLCLKTASSLLSAIG